MRRSMQAVTRTRTPTAARSDDATRGLRPVRPAIAEAMLPYRASPKATMEGAHQFLVAGLARGVVGRLVLLRMLGQDGGGLEVPVGAPRALHHGPAPLPEQVGGRAHVPPWQRGRSV